MGSACAIVWNGEWWSEAAQLLAPLWLSPDAGGLLSADPRSHSVGHGSAGRVQPRDNSRPGAGFKPPKASADRDGGVDPGRTGGVYGLLL